MKELFSKECKAIFTDYFTGYFLLSFLLVCFAKARLKFGLLSIKALCPDFPSH